MQDRPWDPPDYSMGGGLDGTGPLSSYENTGDLDDLDSDDDWGPTTSGQGTPPSEREPTVSTMSLLSSFAQGYLPAAKRVLTSACSYLLPWCSTAYKFRHIVCRNGPLDRLDRAIASLTPCSQSRHTSFNLIDPSSVSRSDDMKDEVYLAKQIATRLFNSTATLQEISGRSHDPHVDIKEFHEMAECFTEGPGVDVDDIMRCQWSKLLDQTRGVTCQRGQTMPDMSAKNDTNWRTAIDGLTAHMSSLSASRGRTQWRNGDSFVVSTAWSLAAASGLALAGYGLYSLCTGVEINDEW